MKRYLVASQQELEVLISSFEIMNIAILTTTL